MTGSLQFLDQLVDTSVLHPLLNQIYVKMYTFQIFDLIEGRGSTGGKVF